MSEKIVNCLFAYKCPLEWGKLQPLENENIRHCGTCQQNVFLAQSLREFDQFAKENKCVAFQPNSNSMKTSHPPMGKPIYLTLLARLVIISIPIFLLLLFSVLIWKWLF